MATGVFLLRTGGPLIALNKTAQLLLRAEAARTSAGTMLSLEVEIQNAVARLDQQPGDAGMIRLTSPGGRQLQLSLAPLPTAPDQRLVLIEDPCGEAEIAGDGVCLPVLPAIADAVLHDTRAALNAMSAQIELLGLDAELAFLPAEHFVEVGVVLTVETNSD